MGRHRKLKEAALACGIVFSLAQQITGAMAFTPEPVAPPSANTQTPSAQFGQPAIPGQIPQGLPDDPLALGVQQKGTEVKIPGIGSVGTLPKLDFGLELLYGPKAGMADAPQLDQHRQESDVQIKGTLTHQF